MNAGRQLTGAPPGTLTPANASPLGTNRCLMLRVTWFRGLSDIPNVALWGPVQMLFIIKAVLKFRFCEYFLTACRFVSESDFWNSYFLLTITIEPDCSGAQTAHRHQFNSQGQRSKVKVKCDWNLINSTVHYNTSSHQVTAMFYQQL